MLSNIALSDGRFSPSIRIFSTGIRISNLRYFLFSSAINRSLARNAADFKLIAGSQGSRGRFRYRDETVPKEMLGERQNPESLSNSRYFEYNTALGGLPMIIKRIELQGFKTFPERTKIVFNPGITIIIGPNGTGKSNIVEAIQWVFGGQRVRTVRGEKIEDSIFSGTVKRPALGMADVTLVLQNAEEEMQINHRVFRSGESEYRLGGKTVRLKDIQDELWKRAISENKYFVIEQGAIGTFVTSKPTEKRALIEEAAGTAYYKDKKRQAENKLQDSEQNLVRLEDIIAEVAKAKNSLARQAGAAERYRILREHIRELTAGHFRQKSDQLLAGQREVQTHLDQTAGAERETQARLSQADKEVSLRRKEAWDLEQALKNGQENLFALKAQAARLEAEMERESKRIEFFGEKRIKAAADSDGFLAEMLLIEQELIQSREDLASNRQAFLRKSGEAEEMERIHRETESAISPRAKKVESLRDDHVRKFSEVTQAKNEGAKLEKELDLVRRQEEKLKGKRDEAGIQQEEKGREIAAWMERRDHVQRDVAEHSQLRESLRLGLGRATAVIEELQEKVRTLTKKRDEDIYHLQALRKMEEKERAAEPLFGIEGALGPFTDLLEADPADAPLIDIFWKEEARATLITPDEFLKNWNSREVRGQFLLVPGSDFEHGAPAKIHDPEVIGWMKSRLRPNPKLGDRLPELADAAIVGDIGAAVRLWLLHPHLNFVSLKGDVLFATGLLKLGCRTEGLFTLAQEIREIELKVSRDDEDIRPSALSLEDNSRKRRELESELNAASERIADLQKNLAEIESRIALGQAELDKIGSDLLLIGHEISVIGMDRDGFTRKWDVHLQGIRGLEEEEQALRSRAEVEEKEFIRHQDKWNEEARALVEARGVLEVLREKIGNLEARSDSLARRKDNAAARIDALGEEIRTADVEDSRLRELILELQARTAAFEEQRREQESKISGDESRRREVDDNLAVAEARLAALRGEFEQKKDARMTWEIRKAEIDRDLVNLEEACWQELKKTIQEVKTEAPAAETGEGDIAAELEEAKDKLQKYGAVNLMAEEEYREQKSRLDFLLQQKKDLSESISQTKDAILKIDEESRTRFLTAVEEINRNFQDLFVSLFKGGTAEIRLTDEADPLESGVEVVAQPPGKKVQNMGLLSGGEKSLTSLAFLFALFRYKPTPFCILDEVDAALDEVNLARFLDLMRAVKSETQFIIITHNYKTMEVADYIYGTTMEEPNVTKVFSMKLEKKGDAVPGD